MKQNVFNITNEETKGKLFRMLLTCFPEFKLVKIRKNGNIVMRERKIFSRRLTTTFLEAVLYYIPKSMSVQKWGNYDLSTIWINKIVDLLRYSPGQYNDTKKAEMVINYLYSEFLQIKFVNVFKDINQYVKPLENGHLLYATKQKSTRNLSNLVIEEATIVTDRNYYFLDPIRRNMHKAQIMAASLVMGVFLTYRIVLTTLTDSGILGNLINFKHTTEVLHLYPWTIIPSSG